MGLHKALLLIGFLAAGVTCQAVHEEETKHQDEPTTTHDEGLVEQCYDCGYQVPDWKPEGTNYQEPIPDVDFCGGKANLDDHAATCNDESIDKCCGVMKSYYTIQDGESPTTINLVARHACMSTLNELYPDFFMPCNENTNGCKNATGYNSTVHEETFVEMCFCEGDRCNNEMPDVLDTTTDVNPETTSHDEGLVEECFDCGYQVSDWKGDESDFQEQIEGVDFCGDKANLNTHAVKCPGDGIHCCGVLKEWTTTDGKKTKLVARHACQKTLADLYPDADFPLCDGATDSCVNITKNEDEGTFVEMCFCEGDRCNDDVPDVNPNPGGASSIQVAQLLCLLVIALACFS